MRRSRFTEELIVAILAESEQGAAPGCAGEGGAATQNQGKGPEPNEAASGSGRQSVGAPGPRIGFGHDYGV